MICLETITGNGIITAEDGQEIQVQHHLQVFQHEIAVRTHDNPAGSIPGLKEIRGTVKPVCFFGQELMLKLGDGRSLKFSFLDTHGNIALSQWIG